MTNLAEHRPLKLELPVAGNLSQVLPLLRPAPSPHLLEKKYVFEAKFFLASPHLFEMYYIYF